MDLTISRPSFAAQEIQSKPPQDVPLWHVNYFELMATETLQAHEKILPLLKEFKFGDLPIATVIIRDYFLGGPI